MRNQPSCKIRTLGMLFVMSLYVLSLASAAFANPMVRPAPLTESDINAWLEGMMPTLLQEHDIAGAVVVVVKDGQVLTQRGFGYSDVQKQIPVDPATTVFRPGSISKLFTWTAVMQLVEQGKIDLDADINTYLDFNVDGRDGKVITMRHLMTHRGGFEETKRDTITYDLKLNFSNEDRVKSFIPNRIFNPGEMPAYSNYGTALAGYIVQRVSGMRYESYIDKAILQPLGMTHSSFAQPLPQNLAANMSRGYRTASGPDFPFEFISVSPAGGMSATGSDMARFMIAHLQSGGALMHPETARLMHTNGVETIADFNKMMLGFYEYNRYGHKIISHSGDTLQFHSSLNLLLDEGVGIFVSFNSTGKSGLRSSPRGVILDSFIERYFGNRAVPITAVPQDAVKDAKLVAGRYAISRRSESNFLALGNIFLTLPANPNGDGSLMINLGRGVERFVHVGPMRWANPKNGELFGARVDNGVVKMVSANSFAPIIAGQPVPAWRSGAVAIPAILAASLIYAIFALSWPLGAIIRLYYKTPASRSGASKLTYHVSRSIAWATFALIFAWVYTIGQISQALIPISSASLLLLQGISAFIGAASIFVAARRMKLAFSSGQRWFAKIGAFAFMAASITIVYVGWIGKAYAMNANY